MLNGIAGNPQSGAAVVASASKALRDITARRGAEMTAHPEERAAAEKELAEAGVTLDAKATPEQILAGISPLGLGRRTSSAILRSIMTPNPACPEFSYFRTTC
jgi:hypothetical protein